VFDEVRYARVDGLNVAYCVTGEAGGRDLVMVSGQFFAAEQLLEDRVARRFMDGLAELGRLVVFDKRGVGLSDPVADWSRPLREQWARDLIAVIEAAGLDRPTVVSWDGFGAARQAAAQAPEAVGRLVLLNPVPTSSMSRQVRPRSVDGQVSTDALERVAFPSRIDEPGFAAWLRRAGRAGASPAVAARLWEAIRSDRRRLTPDGIRAPTLVLHRAQSMTSEAQVREVAEAIEGAVLVQVDGVDVYPIAGDVDPLLTEISRFVTGAAAAPAPDHVLGAVLFTDLVASTDLAVGSGDESWRSVLDEHDARVRVSVERAGGEVIKFTGDGVLAIFPSARSAVRTAHAIRRQLEPLGLRTRAGIHVGDLDRRGGDVSGIAVNAAARIMSQASSGEVLVSESVRLSMLGDGAFEPATVVELKGLPGRWSLHRAP
jgi:class 3 adenylate cyclase/pimeloyl-ACP methyl ester carboxylesterase